MPIRRLHLPCSARLRGKLAGLALLLLLPGLSLATGCRLEFVETSPLSLPVGTNTTLSLRAVDNGAGACSAAVFAVAIVSDTTSGTLLSPLTGTVVGNSVPQVLSTTTPNVGGGSITWRADCVSGCEASNPPSPVFTLNVLGGPRALLLLPGTPDEVPPGLQVPVAVRVSDGGVPIANLPVNWQTLSGSGSAVLPTSTSNPTGIAQNTLNANATPGTSVFRAARSDDPAVNVNVSVESAVYSFQPGSGPTTTAAGQPLELDLRLSRQGLTTTTPAGRPIFWQVTGGPAQASLQMQNDGFTDSGGVSRVTFTGSTPGAYQVEAAYQANPLFPLLLQTFTVTVAGATGSGLDIVDAPARVFSEEVTDRGVEVRVSASQNGQNQPLADVEVSFFISSGNAGFDNGSGLVIARTDADGRASSPPIVAGRNAGPIVIDVAAEAVQRRQLEIEVQPSSYRIQPITLFVPGIPGRPIELPLRLLRRGSGAEVAVADGSVTWSATAGQLARTVSLSNANGESSNLFTAPAPGVYEVEARFEPGPGLAPQQSRFRLNVEGGQLVVLSGDGQRTPAGSTLPFPVVLRAVRNGQPESGVSVRLESVPAGAAEIEPAQTLTDSDGLASFSVRLTPSAQGNVALRGIRSDSSASAPVIARVGIAAAVRRLNALEGDGQSGAPGATLAQPLLVQALDDNQAAAGVRVSFSVRPQGAAEVSPASAQTGADGRLRAQVRLSPAAAGTVSVIAIRSDDPDASAEFALFAAVGGESSLVIETGDLQTGVRGGRGSDLVIRHTQNGLPVEGASVEWLALEGGARPEQSTSLTDAQGRARVGLRFGDAIGGSRIRARINQDLEVSFRVDTIEGQLIALSGDQQRAQAGSPLPEPLVVRLQPQAAGIPVQWRVLSGGGSLRNSEGQTSASGEARSAWTLGPQAGRQTVGVRLGGGAELVFSAEASPLGGGRLEIVSGDGQNLIPGVDSADLQVRVLDAQGVALPGQRVLWRSETASLTTQQTSTDESGRSRVRARLPLPGTAQVTATLEGSESSVIFNLTAGLGRSPLLDRRQRDVADVLDTACAALAVLPNPTGPQSDLLARCRDLATQSGSDPAAVARALSQLPNDVGLNLARAGDEAMRGQTGNLDQRQRALRSPGQRVQMAFAMNTPGGSLPLSTLPALAGTADADATREEAGSQFERWGAFVNGSIGRGRSRQTGLNPAFEYDLGSLTAGVDYRFSDRFVAGAALGLNRDSTDYAAGRGQLDSEGSVLSAYASFWLPKDAYLDASLSYGRNRFELERSLRFTLGSLAIDQRASADTDATLIGGSLSLGRDWQQRSWNLGAYVRAQFSRVEYDAFEEQLISGRAGEGFGLRVESPVWNSLEGVLGGRASRAFSYDWGVLMPNLSIEYSREFRDDPTRLDTRFINDPTGGEFRQSGAAIDTGHVNLSFGMSALFPGGRSGFLQYERRLQDGRISHWLLSIGGRWEF
jgi:outer membrane autotransporter protein